MVATGRGRCPPLGRRPSTAPLQPKVLLVVFDDALDGLGRHPEFAQARNSGEPRRPTRPLSSSTGLAEGAKWVETRTTTSTGGDCAGLRVRMQVAAISVLPSARARQPLHVAPLKQPPQRTFPAAQRRTQRRAFTVWGSTPSTGRLRTGQPQCWVLPLRGGSVLPCSLLCHPASWHAVYKGTSVPPCPHPPPIGRGADAGCAVGGHPVGLAAQADDRFVVAGLDVPVERLLGAGRLKAPGVDQLFPQAPALHRFLYHGQSLR